MPITLWLGAGLGPRVQLHSGEGTPDVLALQQLAGQGARGVESLRLTDAALDPDQFVTDLNSLRYADAVLKDCHATEYRLKLALSGVHLGVLDFVACPLQGPQV